MRFTKFLAIAAILISIGLVQATDLLKVFGVKPNVLLVMMMALSFFALSFLDYSAFILIATVLAGFESGLAIEQLAIAGVSLGAFLAAPKIHWHPFFTNLAFVFFGTLIFYFLSEAPFIITSAKILALELIYNLLFGILLFQIVKDIFKRDFSLKEDYG